MSFNSGRRGRPPKVQKLINDIQSESSVSSFKDNPTKSNKLIKKEPDVLSSLTECIRGQISSRLEMIHKKVSSDLKSKDIEMKKLESNNRDLQLAIKKLENEKLELYNDNKALAKRIQVMLSEESKSAAKPLDDEEREMLTRKCDEAEQKLAKLTEPIELLKKKVKQQENLKSQLNQATGENKSLLMVNDEIKKELSFLNEKHLEVIKAKDKELEQSKQR